MLTRALVSPTLVGRDEELHQLVELRLAAARGRGSLALVSGDAGIGKTRLLQAFRKSLGGGRAAQGVGLCREFGNEPYGPIREALGTLRPGPLALAPADSRHAQLAELGEALAQASARRNVVLLVEDVHWADDGTLHFLQYLLPSLPSLRLFVVATYRSDEACRAAQLEPYLARLLRDRSTHAFELKPLAPAETRRLVRLACGSRPEIVPAQLEEIVERSDGNPLFAEELLKNALGGSDAALPFTVRATVLERVAGLDDRSRNVLSLASVLGRRFGAEFLSAIAGSSLDELLRVLRRLRNLQLIDEVEGEPLGYAFRHALTREAIYGELLSAEARALHGHILSVVERMGSKDAGDLGYHAWAAHDASKATLYNERAGDEARALHAYATAMRAYQRALEFARDADDRGRLLVKAAQSSANDGNSAQAVDLYAAAVDALSACAPPDRLLGIYHEMSAQARIGGDNGRAIAILEDAMSALPERAEREAAMLSLALAHLHLDRGEFEAASALIARSSAAAGTAPFYKVLPYAALVAGDVAGWRATIERTAAYLGDLGAERGAQANFNRAFGLTILGFDGEATALFETLLPELRALRLPALEMLACANLALMRVRGGRLEEARALIERAAAIPEPSTTGPIALAAAALAVGYALWDEELVERLCSHEILEAAFESHINSTLGRVAGPFARWLHARGDAENARAILHRAMASLPAAFGATETFLAAAELGDERTRREAFARIAELDAMRGAPIYAATAAHLRALQSARDRTRAAQPLARIAIECYRELGWPLHEAACLELTGDRKHAAQRYRKLRAPGTLRTMSPNDDGAFAGILSERERQIASLVAGGSVNKRIAELLAVNQRTIEKHLTSIYGKLGLRNRSELAAFIARSG
jgi:DNA-binding CsgD family transcriptional regulator/tetratricopeptide (TPR) repeat protein